MPSTPRNDTPRAQNRLTAALAAALLSTAICTAQKTHVVGPGGYATLDQALGAALAGDEIQITQTAYFASANINKGVTIRAVPGAAVTIARAQVSIARAEETLRVFGLHFIQFDSSPGAGTIVCEDCNFLDIASFANEPLVHVRGSRAFFRRCAMYSTFRRDTLLAQGSHVALSDSRVATSVRQALLRCADHRRAVALVDSQLHAQATLFTASDLGLLCSIPTQAICLDLDAQSRAWLSGCTLMGGANQSWPASPSIRNRSTQAVAAFRTQYQYSVTGPIDTQAELLSVTHVQVPAIGQGFRVQLAGPRGRPYVLVATDKLRHTSSALVPMSIWFHPGDAPPVVHSGLFSSTGDAQLRFVIPNDVRLRDRAVWLTAISGGRSGLLASTPFGGHIR